MVTVTKINVKGRSIAVRPKQILLVDKPLKYTASIRNTGIKEAGKTQQTCACVSLSYLIVTES